MYLDCDYFSFGRWLSLREYGKIHGYFFTFYFFDVCSYFYWMIIGCWRSIFNCQNELYNKSTIKFQPSVNVRFQNREMCGCMIWYTSMFDVTLQGELLAVWLSLDYVRETGLFSTTLPNVINMSFNYYYMLQLYMLLYIPSKLSSEIIAWDSVSRVNILCCLSQWDGRIVDCVHYFYVLCNSGTFFPLLPNSYRNIFAGFLLSDFPKLYMHMLHQRGKVLGSESKIKEKPL